MPREDAGGQEKSEQPTAKRMRKAREEGQVAKSHEINFVTGLMAAAVYFALTGSNMLIGIKNMMHRLLTDGMLREMNPETSIRIIRESLADFVAIILPVLAILVVVAIVANVLQVGFVFTARPFKPNIEKFNPIKGMRRIFSMKKVLEIFKDAVKLLIISIVPYLILKGEMEHLLLITDMQIWDIMCYIGSIVLKIIFYVSLAVLLLALLDYLYQRWSLQRELMMTKQEVKDEFKQSEGDPKIKARIRQIQFQFLRKMMMQEVPKADVVITNPVHVAVALKYERKRMEAPRVIAKGARLMAERIKQIARENNVPIVENRLLAQSVYKLVDVGDTIPESLYKAVAEVLAYVYGRRRRPFAAAQ